MKLYHQIGFRFKWNIESYENDNTGNGLILSPVNIEKGNILELSSDLKSKSFFDPQFYLPKDAKGKLSTYDFFPANIINNFKTCDFDSIKDKLAKKCIDFQLENNFEYILIPTIYLEDLTSSFYEQIYRYFIEPFINYYKSLAIENKLLLTFIVKQTHIINETDFNFLLSWLTSIDTISGVYLIFENDFPNKQIKNPTYLFNVLKLIHNLKMNNFIVSIGYNNIEGILYSISNPDSISMGSYENLRRFGIKRFVTTSPKPQNSPVARLYSSKLFQFIDYRYIDPITSMYRNWRAIFEDSKYHPLMFKQDYKWHFQKPEPYKHFFLTFNKQIKEIPDNINERINRLKLLFDQAINIFKEINESGVILDENSDGSHLTFWLTALNMYEKYLMDNNYDI